MSRDYLAYCDLATDRQQRAYDIVREYDALTCSRAGRRNATLSDTLRAVTKLAVGDWCSTRLPPPPKAKTTDADAKVLKAKLLLNRTGPYRALSLIHI